MSRFLAAALAVAVLAGPVAALADAPVPVRVRVMKGTRNVAPAFDPRLADLKHQLNRLAYVKWEQASEKRLEMRPGKTEFVELPHGEMVALELLDVRGSSVTFEVGITQRNTQSRLTIEKGQRIVHQVTAERDGAAYFVAVMPWP